MTLEKDDPKLTAFALGELSPAERAEVEAALAQDPALAAEVEAIQGLGGMLGAALAEEPLPKLAETQRAAIEAKAGAPRASGRLPLRGARRKGPGKLLSLGTGGAMAAGLLVTASLWSVSRSAMRAESAGAPTAAPAHYEELAQAPPPTASAPPETAELHRTAARDLEKRKADLTQREAQLGRLRQDEAAGRPVAGPPAADPMGMSAPTAPAPPVLQLQSRQEPPSEPDTGGEQYAKVQENGFLRVGDAPLSTFSIDVDRASYAVVRRWITQQGHLPPADAVRLEELINYFPYADAPPPADAPHPFAVKVDVAGCPWNERARLVRIGLKGKELRPAERPPANLVFLLDVSGSMNAPNKLPLVRDALRLLVENLSERDRVSIVVYAGASGLALPPTPCDRGADILDAFSRLSAGGSTNGGAGIQLAYKVAQDAFLEGGVNRVILCTDGDFNVGTTSHQALLDLIAKKARSKVFLTVLGFGMGNLKDHLMEQLADKGNGNYGYVDTIAEARKLLVEELSGTLVTIAKDVKIQVEWNPAAVQSYRLIGYENRKLRDEDFNDDTKDAGEIGAGHAVTALYEVVPVGAARPGVDPLKYQEPPAQLTDAARSGEMLTVKLRYKQPEGDVSELLDVPARDEGTKFQDASADLRFAAAVAEFGMVLRGSEHKGTATLESAFQIGVESLGADQGGHREEFLQLVRRAMQLGRR